MTGLQRTTGTQRSAGRRTSTAAARQTATAVQTFARNRAEAELDWRPGEREISGGLDQDDFAFGDDFPELPLQDDETFDVDTSDAGDDLARFGWRTPAAVISLWIEDGVVRFDVRRPDPERLLDPNVGPKIADRHRRLTDYAEQLSSLVRPTLATATLREAYESLPALPKSSVVGRDQSQFSRDRSLLVGTPFGTVPLDFFFWRDGNWKPEIDQLVLQLLRHPSILTATQQELAAEASRQLQIHEDTVKPYVGFARAVVAFPHIVRSMRTQFRLYPDEFEQVLGSAEESLRRHAKAGVGGSAGWAIKPGRGSAVLQRALVGFQQ